MKVYKLQDKDREKLVQLDNEITELNAALIKLRGEKLGYVDALVKNAEIKGQYAITDNYEYVAYEISAMFKS